MNRAAAALGFAFVGLSFSTAAPESSQEGPRYEFPDNTSPQVVMELKEVSREKRGKPTFVHYRLAARGFTPGKKVDLYQWVWNLDNGILSQSGFQVDESGKIACPQPAAQAGSDPSTTQCSLSLDEVQLNAAGFLWGQVFMLGLLSADGEEKGFVETIPFPIEAEDHGCRLEAKRLSVKGDAWLIEGDGFRPREGIDYAFKGSGKTFKASEKLKETGKLSLVLSSPDVGDLNGSVTLTVEASACKAVLRFKWGISSIKYP